MNPAPLLSIVSGLLGVLLSVVFYFKSSAVQHQTEELQKQQTVLQTEQQTLQTEQQKFQNQQQQIQAGMQLAQQIGPAVLQDLGLKARDNKNDKIRKLLQKYGVEINDKAAASPAPSSSAPASTPAPAAPRLQ